MLQTDKCQTQNTETHSLGWKNSNRNLHLFRGTRPLVYAWAGPRAALGPLPCLMSGWEKPPDLQQEQLSVLLLVLETNVLLMGHHNTVVLHAVIQTLNACCSVALGRDWSGTQTKSQPVQSTLMRRQVLSSPGLVLCAAANKGCAKPRASLYLQIPVLKRRSNHKVPSEVVKSAAGSSQA